MNAQVISSLRSLFSSYPGDDFEFSVLHCDNKNVNHGPFPSCFRIDGLSKLTATDEQSVDAEDLTDIIQEMEQVADLELEIMTSYRQVGIRMQIARSTLYGLVCEGLIPRVSNWVTNDEEIGAMLIALRCVAHWFGGSRLVVAPETAGSDLAESEWTDFVEIPLS